MSKIETPQSKLKDFTKKIIEEVKHWNEEYKNGCSDPFWPDGINLNLTRNHVIYYKNQILRICEKNNLKVPQEYFAPVPQYVDNNYFAKPDSERAKKMLRENKCTNIEKVNKVSSNQQMSLF